jgi:hypothetical protein
MNYIRHKRKNGYCIHCQLLWYNIFDSMPKDQINNFYKMKIGQLSLEEYSKILEDHILNHATILCLTEEEYIIKSIIE